MSAPKVILLRETVLQSWLSDGVTLAMLAGLPWFNFVYCGGSGWINAAIAIAWLISIVRGASGLSKSTQYSPAEARAWLDEHYPDLPARASERAA